MSVYAVDDTILTGIADAIREKRDMTTEIPIEDMAMQIGLIEAGGGNEDAPWVKVNNIAEFFVDADTTSLTNTLLKTYKVFNYNNHPEKGNRHTYLFTIENMGDTTSKGTYIKGYYMTSMVYTGSGTESSFFTHMYLFRANNIGGVGRSTDNTGIYIYSISSSGDVKIYTECTETVTSISGKFRIRAMMVDE